MRCRSQASRDPPTTSTQAPEDSALGNRAKQAWASRAPTRSHGRPAGVSRYGVPTGSVGPARRSRSSDSSRASTRQRFKKRRSGRQPSTRRRQQAAMSLSDDVILLSQSLLATSAYGRVSSPVRANRTGPRCPFSTPCAGPQFRSFAISHRRVVRATTQLGCLWIAMPSLGVIRGLCYRTGGLIGGHMGLGAVLSL
jgi:hypothetical protein